MEKFRRTLKIFWTEHGTPILFWIIVIIVVIIITQSLNNYAIKQQNKKKEDIYQKNIEQPIFKENNANTQLVKKFIDYCENEQIENAYGLLSENCKKELYPTAKDFSNLYYNQLFKKKHNIEIKYNSKDDIYEVIFYEDILESGKIENRNNVIDQYKIEKEVLEDKIYININQSIK